ncbi:MAG TPA: DUF4349 domain-containing protein [Dehalococcoidales bacterium]
MRKRWLVIIAMVVLIAAFIVYQCFPSSSGTIVDMMIAQNAGPYFSENARAELEMNLGLDKPAYTRIFDNFAVPAPQSYPVSNYYSSSSGSNTSTASPATTLATATITDNIASQRMIVRTANLTMVVNDIAVAISQITQLTNDNDGYVVSANKTSTDKSITGIVSIRVPASQFDSIMNSIRTMAVKVTSDNISATDVSEEDSDLSARLKNLETAETQLTEIMKKAEKVEDVVAVQRQLTATREEIELTKGRMQYLEQTSAMSLITVSLQQSTLTINLYAGTRYARTKDNIGFAVNIQGGISPFSYEWDFGDGVTSIDMEPWHEYSGSGNYTVTVTITDDKGNKAIEKRTNYITIYPGWSPGDVLDGAWRGLLSFLRFLFAFLVWLLIFSPFVLAVIFVVLFIRRTLKRRKLKSSA